MNDSGCIYACGMKSPSTQEYHLYPASASTYKLVIPPGPVCDGCNNYFAAELENHFVQHHPGSSMRVVDGVVTRKGKTPRFTHENGEMTRVDGADSRHVTTQLGDMRFERHPNGDMTIIGSYTPRPFDASIVSRLLHKCAFEVLLGYQDQPELNPRSERFTPLRDYVRRPKSRTDFQPFLWKRRDAKQGPPTFVTLRDPDTNEVIAEVCEVTFPGIAYLVAYPPWPAPELLWSIDPDAHAVRQPGMTTLAPEEIRIPLTQMRNSDSPVPTGD